MAFGPILIMWNKWNIRGFVMLSLWLQVFLILFAPLRKKTSNQSILSLLWLAYLMADWVAAFAIGLICHNQSNSSACAIEVDGALLAFWASFLLLHLGGPDTITAFSMEDSSLWRRHLLSLVFQVSSAIYVFVQIFPTDKSLLIPTMLVFLAGVIKNAERTAALNLSSFPKLREWVISQRRRPSDVAYKSQGESTISQLKFSNENGVQLAESIVVKHAYYFFQKFAVLLGDLMFTFEDRQVSREYFHEVSAMDALRVISIELQFMYEVLHTKTLAMCSKWSHIFRFIAFANVSMAFILFNHLKKHQLPKLDVEITHSLLFGGIAIEVIALLMFVFSDWTIARIKPVSNWTIVGIKPFSYVNKFGSATNHLRKPRFATCEAHPNAIVTYMALDTCLMFQRWSESISACNLLSEYLRKSPRKMWKRGRNWGGISFSSIYTFQVLPFFMLFCNTRTFDVPRIANTKNMSTNPFIKELWIYIFMEVKRKSKNADNEREVKKIFEARGNLFLDDAKGDLFLNKAKDDLFLDGELWKNNCGNLSVYVTQANFDASIIMWHIATELWYNKEKPTAKNEEREFSNILSDYMMYLLFNQPNLVSTVAGIAQIRSAKILLEMFLCDFHQQWNIERLCEELYEGFQRFDEESLPRKAINLAREIERLGHMKWRVMSGVWVEMLSYAATHIKGETHVQVLSKGGELLVFVWLLMAHFGCLYKPEWGICADSLPEFITVHG